MLVTILRLIGGIIIVATIRSMEKAVFDGTKDYEQFYAAHHKTNKEDE
jgi:hypothetical protein